MRNLARSSALEVCRIVGGELVTTLVESKDGELWWSYSSKSGSGSGQALGNPAEAYDAALAAAVLAVASKPKVHEWPVVAVWDYASKRGQVLEVQGVGKYVFTGLDFPTEKEAVKYVDEYKASNIARS